jgi:hypothetical protein
VVTVEEDQPAAGLAMLFVLQENGCHPTLTQVDQCRPSNWFIELGYQVIARNRSLFDGVLFHLH